MIDDILPGGVATAEAFCDLADVMLYPDEEAVAASAVDNRAGNSPSRARAPGPRWPGSARPRP